MNKIKKSKTKFPCYGIRFPQCNIGYKDLQYIRGCKNCGPYDHLVINERGYYKMCNSINEIIGTINDDLLEVWRNNSLVKEFKTKNILPEQCKKCAKINSCYGGCRFAAFIGNGQMNSLHPLAK
jgi:radical SAM protein with 4Fe4S-binding SPASM domain